MFTVEQKQYLLNSKVCFMVPCYGGAVFEQFFVSFMKNVIDFNGNKLSFGLETVSNESLVTRARNTLIAKAMSNPSNTHFMFIDADISFTTLDVWKLMLADKDVIGGLYPKKSYPIEYVYNALDDQEVDAKGLVQVKQIGTGFMLIKRSTIERMFVEYRNLKYINDLQLSGNYQEYFYSLFDTSIDEQQRYCSEDWTFCNRLRAIGGEIWAHTHVKLGHSGYHTFK